MPKLKKVITIPADIQDEFFNLLDLAQASITQEDEKNFSKKEKRCLAFVRGLIRNPSCPFKDRAEAVRAARGLRLALRIEKLRKMPQEPWNGED